jgi:NAD(P)-dependent dehydrogenase (short-subunit alcohol dehydrogenase family)
MGVSLDGKVAWVTGAGSGIGQAAAVALAEAGARLVLSGRREGPLEATAAAIRGAGGLAAAVAPADVADPAAVAAVAGRIGAEFGRCDILVNSVGLNVRRRAWGEVDAAGFAEVLGADLAGPFHAVAAVLPMMRARRDGLIVHIASWAGRHVLRMPGPAYTAAKHGLVALSESLNKEECVNGIRSCCICPADVATPILDARPVPVPEEERARMLQVRDLAAAVLFVAGMPASVCVNEILISPTWNRFYIDGREP